MSIQLNIQSSREWLGRNGSPLIVAGPCSAESESQIMEVAKTLAEAGGVNILRAGVWKPRTRPNSFEGLGSVALPWLVKAQNEFGLPWAVEVATAEHVRQALEAGIRHVWIGARTTVNPFSVQEIADVLRGSDIPVFVKNPLNPDLNLWIGALERLNAAGITKLVAVHRGFNTYQDHVFRNSPNWEIPIELKTKFPTLEVITDPSHIGGKRSLLHGISQKALDLGFDGLMIETHPNPDEALSDAKQQIALQDFTAFLAGLEIKQKHFEDSVALDQLAQLRKLIDEVDHNLIENLKRRSEIVELIGQYKAEHGVTVFQLERWREIFKDRIQLAEQNEVDQELVALIWKAIHQSSIKQQTEIGEQHFSENG